MLQERKHSSYIYRLTLVATLGGLLFGYDTAVVSGAVKAIREFFVEPMTQNIGQAREVITGYRITISVAVFIVGLAVSGMLIRLFSWKKGLIISTIMFILAAIVLMVQFGNSPVVTMNNVNAITGFTVSAALIGCIIGGSVAGFVSLSLGRKKGLILAASLFILSGIGAAFPEKMGIFGMFE